MPEARMRSFTIEAKFVAYDPNLISPNKANVLIKKMQKSLADFKINKGHIKAYVLVIDEFQCDQINTNLIHGSWKLRIELVDLNEDGGAIGRFNIHNDGGFSLAICALRFTKYQTICKIVPDFDNLGDLTVGNPTSEPGDIDPSQPSMGEQKFNFYERFSRSVADYAFLGRVLVLEKELARLREDVSLTDEARKDLVKKTSIFINSLKQNMKDSELEELVYFQVSLDQIPGI